MCKIVLLSMVTFYYAIWNAEMIPASAPITKYSLTSPCSLSLFLAPLLQILRPLFEWKTVI